MAFGLIISLTYLRNAQSWTLRREAGVLEYGNPRGIINTNRKHLAVMYEYLRSMEACAFRKPGLRRSKEGEAGRPELVWAEGRERGGSSSCWRRPGETFFFFFFLPNASDPEEVIKN